MLSRHPAVLIADAEERDDVPPEPFRLSAPGERIEELVEEARAPEAISEARLVLGPHEEHLVDEELRVVRVVPSTQPEQQVDLVDAGEVAGVRAAVLQTADAIRLVVRPAG